MNIPSIAILITSHNRSKFTYKCIEHIYNQSEAGNTYYFKIFLVDDNSSDGTPDLIKSKFPDVQLIYGDGNLFWNRGMNKAWNAACNFKKFDFFLWLNDDTFLYENAIVILLSTITSSSIVAGSTCSTIGSNITYGGYVNNHVLLIPNNQIQKCHYFNGNCVLIPYDVYNRLGLLDAAFHHALGDFDYGRRARKLNIDLLVAPASIGVCESHQEIPNWTNPKYPLLKRTSFLYHPLSGCHPRELFKFEKRHFGILTALYHYFTIHLRLFFPCLNKIKPLK